MRPPIGAFNKMGGLELGHQSRQRAVSLWRRSGDHTLHHECNALVMFLLIGRTEAPQYENFSSNRREISRPAPCLLHKHLKESAKVGYSCLLYTSDAADDLLCVDLGGRRIIKKKKN